jgi:redox-sensitive bicupin YhaK (pirin superfamily)
MNAAASVQLIPARTHDIGDFAVARALPSAARRSVGPFVFVDHFGPVQLPAGRGMDVRPHPHIGLATVTYLFEGEIVHRDSLGTVQAIRPGDINWMTAGRGIVHSERSPQSELVRGARLHGMQTWVALPVLQEEAEPAFTHTPATALPTSSRAGARIAVLIGTAFGLRSPVVTPSPMLYAALELPASTRLALDAAAPERALYVAQGTIEVGGTEIGAGALAVLPAGAELVLGARDTARVMLLGGAPLDGGGQRFMWWNFVSSRRERIEQAKADWAAQRMGLVPDETEFIPLPPR